MIGVCYIDGVDIYDDFGVSITDGGYDGLITFPSLKTPETNDWSEENGQDVDLSEPVLDSHEFSMGFCGNSNSSIADFIASLTDGAYHYFNFIEIDQTFRLRLVSQSNLSINQGMKLFTLTFADDFPLFDYEYSEPFTTNFLSSGYWLDDRDLGFNGLLVLQGSEAEIEKTPAVKKNLTVNINNLSGLIYDGDAVSFQAKDVTLKFRIIAESLAAFWNNYKALLFDLTRPGTRTLYSGITDLDYTCYYKSSSVSKFSPTGSKVWCDFSVTLCFNAISTGSIPPIEVIQKTIEYGFLYNYRALDNIAASNAHVATAYDWNNLMGLSSPNDADHLKEAGFVHWSIRGGRNPNNSTGFTAMPGGNRNIDGSYTGIGQYGKYWCADFLGGSAAFAQFVFNSGGGNLYNPSDYLNIAAYVRLVVNSPNTDNGDGTGEYIGNDGQKYACKVMPDGNFWITKNLCETFLNDLTPIPEVSNTTTWTGLTGRARCCYNNEQANAFV